MKRRALLEGTLRVADLVGLLVSLLVAAWVTAVDARVDSFTGLLAIRFKLSNALILLGLLVVWYLIFKAAGLHNSRLLSSRWIEVLNVVKATSISVVILLATGTLFSITLLTPLFTTVFWLASTLLTVAMRLLAREFLAWLRAHGRNLRDVIIVGTNQRALGFASKLRARADLGYQVLGFVDDDWPGLDDFRRAGEQLVADSAGLLDYLRTHAVDEVIIALPVGSAYTESERVLRFCEEQGICVRFLPDIFDLTLAKKRIEMFGDDPIVTWQTHRMEGAGVVAKRVLDLTLALLVLVALLPLLLVVAVLIRATSRGSILFVQERVGLNKRVFPMFKFRTMVSDAEERQAEVEHLNEVEGPVFKVANDPRVTPLGEWLRRTSIDELPQLLNVVRGEMSLVGPRPLPVRDYKGFDQDWHRRRFSVRPGITCLWQVSGRSGIPFERWMELDLKYIDEWSFWLDLKILAKTVPAVLHGSGAA